MFGACQRRSAELPKAALRLYSSRRDCLANVLLAAPAVENSACDEYVSSDQSGNFSCEGYRVHVGRRFRYVPENLEFVVESSFVIILMGF